MAALPAAALAPPGPLPGLHLHHLDERVKTTRYAKSRRLRDKTYLERFIRFVPQNGHMLWIEAFLSDLAYEDNNNESWIPDRPLGRGGFGSVTRWVKKDPYGSTIDTLAMKEAENPEFWHPGLAQEAFIQSQLTNDSPESVINLRGYRYYTNEDKFRLYMENAKYGTLEHIRRCYRAWDTYLPEVFLWTIFHELALAVEALEQCPKRWTRMTEVPTDLPHPDNHILHFDLKPGNVFLCGRQRIAPDEIFPAEYPQIKIGDFGISERTSSRADPHNPNRFHHGLLGDATVRTPEQRRWGANFDGRVQPALNLRYDPQPPQPPQPPPNDIGFRFGPKQNVWQIGIIMYDTMAMARPNRIADALRAGENEVNFMRNIPNTQTPRRHFMNQPTTEKTEEYTDVLRRMILMCLRPEVNRRPSPEQLVRMTRNRLRYVLRQSRERRRPGTLRAAVPAVAVTPAAMNRLRCGADSNKQPVAIQWNLQDEVEWKSLRDRMYHDADQPRLQPPDEKWGAFYEHDVRLGEDTDPEAVWKSWARFGEHAHPTDPDSRTFATLVRRFDGADMDNAPLRDALMRVQAAVRAFAGAKPMNMVEYVLQKEKMDEAETQQVLSWLYNNAQADDHWGWVENDDFVQKASHVQKRGAFMEWTLKECLYVVATTGFGVDHVDAAVDVLRGIYNS